MISAARPVASRASARSSTSAAWPSIQRVFSESSPTGIRQLRDSAPEGQRLVEAGHRLDAVAGGCGITAHLGGQLVARGIGIGFGEDPAHSLGQDEAVIQRAPQRGYVRLERLGGGARRIIAP